MSYFQLLPSELRLIIFKYVDDNTLFNLAELEEFKEPLKDLKNWYFLYTFPYVDVRYIMTNHGNNLELNLLNFIRIRFSYYSWINLQDNDIYNSMFRYGIDGEKITNLNFFQNQELLAAIIRYKKIKYIWYLEFTINKVKIIAYEDERNTQSTEISVYPLSIEELLRLFIILDYNGHFEY